MTANTVSDAGVQDAGVNPPARTLSPAAFYLIALVSVILDQAVKEWVRTAMPVHSSIPLLPGVFHLTHTQNPGMAFSLLEGKTGILAAAAFAVVGVIIVTQWRLGGRMPLLLGWALSLPLGGAIGNLIDRLRHGYVTDLFDFRLIHFPVFNVADSAISIGVILLAWHTLRTPEDPPAPKAAPVEGEG